MSHFFTHAQVQNYLVATAMVEQQKELGDV